jgi:hypothetical protein
VRNNTHKGQHCVAHVPTLPSGCGGWEGPCLPTPGTCLHPSDICTPALLLLSLCCCATALMLLLLP